MINQNFSLYPHLPNFKKIAMIKELRQATSWPLKSSKSIAEYLMVYDLLTNPSSRRLMQKIKYGT